MANTIDLISVSFAILTFIGFILYRLWSKKSIILIDIVIVVLAGGMLPIAIAFIVYPLYPESISSIENMSLQITVTGLVLSFVYVKTIIERIKSDSS